MSRLPLPRNFSLVSLGLLIAGLCAVPRAEAGTVSYNFDKKFSFDPGTAAHPKAVLTANTSTSATGALPDSDEQPSPPGNEIPAGGTLNVFSFSIGPNASALAVANGTLDNFGAGDPLSGNVNVHGTAISNDPAAGAGAHSSSKVTITGIPSTATTGKLSTDPISLFSTKFLNSDDPKGAATASDPMSFEVFDLDNGQLLKAILFDFKMELLGEGGVIWDHDGLVVDAQDFTFKYDLTSPFLINQGLIEFAIAGGMVTTSNATGILAGLLPSVGSTGPFHLALSSERILDYDLGDFGGHALDISFIDEAAGSAEIVAVPEPGTVAAGLVLAGFCAVKFLRRRRHRHR